MSEPAWYLLIHQIPAKPLYLRAKIRKRLASMGAVALKDAVYVMPARKPLLPRLQEIAEEARSGGADAYILLASFVDAGTREALIDAFRGQRTADYEALAQDVRAWTAELKRRSHVAPPEGAFRARLARTKKRLSAIREIDFFDSPARGEAEATLAAFESQLRPEPAAAPAARHHQLVGRTWVTRRGIQVDRIASAWFIRRFLDAKARLRFIDPGVDEVQPEEIRFDMVDGEFTHEGDRCTFETLVLRTGIKDPALTRLAEVVHDMDIKDGKFGHPETSGVQQLLLGMLMANHDDEARLDRGFALFDDLYQSFRGRLRSPPPGSAVDGPSGKARPLKGGRT
jgi:hypothetical protein